MSSLALACFATAIITVLSIGAGAVAIAPMEVIRILWEIVTNPSAEGSQNLIILREIRLPRVLLSLFAGGSLAVCGVLMQAFFRNPLADPALIGVATGGALGAVSVIVLGATFMSALTAIFATLALPLAAFAGSLITTVVIYLLSRREGVVDATGMLLSGIAINAIAGAGIGLLTFLATDAQLRNLTFWSLGSLSSSSWGQATIVGCACFILAMALPFLIKPLNALLLGDSEARHLGVDVERLKAVILVLTSLSAGVVVATCGVVGFVGLIAPHFARLMVGPDHRAQLPLAAILGAALMCFADMVARTVVAPAELPLGVLTALAGGPLFVWMLSRRHGTAFHA